MPAALHGTEHSEMTSETSANTGVDAVNEMTPEMVETFQFLQQVQQQAIETDHSKIASLSFPIEPIAPWAVLSALGNIHQRHFYYDSPQQWAIVGLDVVVGCSAEGPTRFTQAQTFTQKWQTQFVHAKTNSKADLPGRFFCSATFFDVSPDCFEPVYIFVPQVQVMTLAEGSNVTFNYLIAANTEIAETTQHLYARRSQLMGARSLGAAKPASKKVIVRDVENFEGAVAGALQQLDPARVHKVVLADVMDVEARQNIDVVRSLQTLRKNHPDCTVFSVGNGKGQSFIGASPERLLSINEGRLTTDALAGSASRGHTPEADQAIAQALLNSEKERYEHQVVVEFIARQLRSLGLTPRHTTEPSLLQLFHIQHLHTPMSADLDATTISPLDVLAKLHPTPAVAGLPLQDACKLIHQYENFERGLYAAPLGWIDTKGNSEFIVGIRSALVDGASARLYAGAGIVAGSEPKKELAEIKLKLQTLLNALV
ncbi:MAG: isochorismate synthase [Cyanobacteria bacterium J06649_4]